MRILLLHNRYVWPGGEDVGVTDDAAQLRSHGHDVVEHIADNRPFVDAGKLALVRALWRAAWSRPAYAELRAKMRAIQPDILHLHNFWFALSPSVLAAAHDENVPTVVTLHNFRLLCPAGVLLDRSGQACQRCVGGPPWPGAWRRCYHGSFFASALAARMIAINRRRHTWERDADLLIVPSEFCRQTFARGGLPTERMVVKPHAATDPFPPGHGPAPAADDPLRALFLGRLGPEKGLRTLLAAWPAVYAACPHAELRLVGDGPLRGPLERTAADLPVTFAGAITPAEVPRELAQASLLVLPSECFETFGRSVVEAYASGRPVLVSRLGGPAELVADGETGRLFAPGDPADLADKLTRLLRDPADRTRMGANARQAYLERYTPAKSYEALMECYERAKALRCRSE